MASITERIASGVPNWGAKLAYGETQTVGGTEMVPVAFVAFGFGAGEGATGFKTPEEDSEVGNAHGEGGGGGGSSIPLGAYIAGPDGLRFQTNPVVLLALSATVIGAVGVAISAIIAASKLRR